MKFSEGGPDNLLRFIDVGGAGGIQPKWYAHADQIFPVLFEPNPAEAGKLQNALRDRFPHALVLEKALSHVSGARNLNITRHWGCASFLKPNETVLNKYRIAPLFDVMGSTSVDCVRYDTLHNQGLAPPPDAIKIDVQGFEYEVLQGFGGLLQDCLGIELETHVYPLYNNQKLLHHLIEFLSDFGFVLRRANPILSFDGDIVEFDVWFTKDIEVWRKLSQTQRQKFSLICRAWDLIDYSRIDPAAKHNEILPVASE